MTMKKDDYYEYDKTVKEPIRDIQILERQIAALEGSTYTEDKIRKMRLEEMLEECKNEEADKSKIESEVSKTDDLYEYNSKKLILYRLNTFKDLYKDIILQKNFSSQKFARSFPLVTLLLCASIYLIKIFWNMILNGITTNMENILLCTVIAMSLFSYCFVLRYFIKCFFFDDIMMSPENCKELFDKSNEWLKNYSYYEVFENIKSSLCNSYEDATIKLFNEIDKKESYMNKLYISLIACFIFTCLSYSILFLF